MRLCPRLLRLSQMHCSYYAKSALDFDRPSVQLLGPSLSDMSGEAATGPSLSGLKVEGLRISSVNVTDDFLLTSAMLWSISPPLEVYRPKQSSEDERLPCDGMLTR